MFSELKKKLKRRVGAENVEFLSLTKDYLSGTVVEKVLIALSIPLFTRLLSPADYGTLSVYSSLVTLLIIVFSLNLRGGITRYYLEKLPDFDKALSSNLVFIVAFNVVSFAVVMLFSDRLAPLFAIDSEVFRYAALVSVLFVSFEVYLSYLQGSKQSSRYAVLTVTRTFVVLGFAVGLILMLDEKKYLGRMYAEVVASAFLCFYAYWRLIKLAKRSFDFSHIRYTLRFSLPLMPHAVSRYILGYFDRIILKQLTNAADTGIYSFAYDIGMAMNVVVMATIKAWNPIFFEEYRLKNYEKIDRMVYTYANYMYLGAVAIILFAVDVVTVLADEKFFAALELVPVIIIGYVFVFLYTIFFQYATFRKKTELVSLNTFIAGFANIGLNYWLIPIYGYRTAAYTSLVCFALLFVLFYVTARFVLKERCASLGRLLPNLIIVLAIAALQMYLAKTLESYWLFLLIRLAIMGAAAYYFLSRNGLTGKRHAG